MRDFSSSLIQPFVGSIGSQSVSAHRKPVQQPQASTLTIDWYEYALKMDIAVGAVIFNGAVSVDLRKGAVTSPLDVIKSVFVDNTSVDRPVYLRCEDTGQIVTVPDGYFGWYPVITNGFVFTLFTDNIVPLRNARQKTRLIFSNTPFDTFGQPELNRAQSLYRASGSSNFIAPVLADRSASALVDIQNMSQNQTIIDRSVLEIPNFAEVVLCSYKVYMSFQSNNGGSATWDFALNAGGTDIDNVSTRPPSGGFLYETPFLLLSADNIQLSIRDVPRINMRIKKSFANTTTTRFTLNVTLNYALIERAAFV